MLADVFAELGVALTPAIAEALYAGLVTDTGRFQYANTTPKALRLAADLLEAGADVQRGLPGRLRVDAVREAEAARSRARPGRSSTRTGGRRLVPRCAATSARWARWSRTPRASSTYLRAVEGAELAALIREPPRDGSPARKISLRSSTDASTSRRSRARSGGGGHRQAAGFSSDLPIDEITAFIVSEFAALRAAARLSGAARWRSPRRLEPTGVILVDKPAGPSSFAVVAGVRRAHGGEDGARRHARPVRDRAARCCCPGGQRRLASCFVGLPSATSPTSTSRARTTTGDPEGEPLEEHEPPPSAESSKRALEGLRGEIELPIPTASAVKIGGERAYRLHRQGVVVEMPLRRSRVDALDVIAYADGIATLDLRVSSGTYVRSIADALGGHCVTLRRTEVGPFSVDEADAERVRPLDEALGRIGLTVAEAEAERQRRGRDRSGSARRGTAQHGRPEAGAAR